MDEWLTWLTDSPPGQFIVGVLVLIFGARGILTEENLKGKLWGLGTPHRWLKRRQEQAAQEEVSELNHLRIQNELQHQYILWITSMYRTIQIWAANHGHEMPPPPFRTYNQWKQEKEERGE